MNDGGDVLSLQCGPFNHVQRYVRPIQIAIAIVVVKGNAIVQVFDEDRRAVSVEME